MRRSIWTPVGVTVLLLLASATVPRIDLRQWSTALPEGARGMIAPSWPVPALRTRARSIGAPPAAWFMPSWPVPALRGAGLWHARERGPAGAEAGPLFAARRVAAWQSLAHLCLAIALGVMAATAPLAVASHITSGRGFVFRRVHALSARGLPLGRIARHAQLPRDAVRAMLLSPAPPAARKRA